MRDSEVFLVSIFNSLNNEYGAPMPVEHMSDAVLEFSRFLARPDISPLRGSFVLCVYGRFDVVSGVLTRYDEIVRVDASDKQVLDFIEKLEAFEASKKRGAAVGGVNPPQVAERPEGQFDC